MSTSIDASQAYRRERATAQAAKAFERLDQLAMAKSITEHRGALNEVEFLRFKTWIRSMRRGATAEQHRHLDLAADCLGALWATC